MTTQPLYFHRLWLAIGWALVGVVIYLSLSTSPPDLELEIPFSDKIGHLLAYMTLAGWFAQIEERRAGRAAYALLFILLGIVLEYLQGMGGVRYQETADMLANTLGVMLGLWLSTTLLRGVLGKVDARVRQFTG